MTSSRCRVLVVDDESAMREVLQVRLEGWGFDVRTVATVRAARAIIPSFDPRVVISDLVMPDDSGMGLLESLRAGDASRTVLMITAYGTINTAVQAIKAGATDFLTKPLDYVALRRLLDQVADAPAPRRAPTPTPTPEDDTPAPAGIIGRSLAMTRMWDMIDAAAASEAPVLIVGESGAGKERVARAIHERGRRAERAFVPVNAAAIPEALAEAELFGYERGAFTGATETRRGLIEEAHRGTLFLDEITEMPAGLQPKLLRVLEDGNVRRVGGRIEMACDARVIAATNRSPREAVADGRLRHDLLYRLDVMRVDVPPLRDRRDDIPALAAHFLAQCVERYGEPSGGLTAEALEALGAYDWPGNVRELRNVIERAYAAARGTPITTAHVTAHVGPTRAPASAPDPAGIVIPRGVTAADAERILILETLKATENNKAEAARRLGLDVKTIRNKLKAFHLDGGDE